MQPTDLDTIATSNPAVRDKPERHLSSIAIMKAQLKKTLAAAVLAAVLPAQTQDHEAALQRAALIERQEGDLAAAQKAYEALLDDDATPSEVREAARFQLGSLLWRLDKKDGARAALGKVAAGNGAFADRARQLLQGDTPEAKARQERIQQARAIIKRYSELQNSGQDPSSLIRELHNLGSAAASAIVEELNVGPALQNNGELLTPKNKPLLLFLIQQLWAIGTEPASEFLIEAARSAPLPWQRFLLNPGMHGVAEDLAPAAKAFTESRDPTREVLHRATQILGRLPLSSNAVVPCLESDHPGTRQAGLKAMADVMSRGTVKMATDFLEQHNAVVAAAFDYRTPGLAEASRGVIRVLAQRGGEIGSRLLLDQIAKNPTEIPKHRSWNPVTVRDDWMRLAARTAAAIGPRQIDDQRPAHQLLHRMVSEAYPEWGKAGVASASQLVSLGYAKGASFNERWLQQMVALGSTTERVTMIRQLPEMFSAQTLTNRLLQHDPDPLLLPAIGEVLAQCEVGGKVRWFRPGDGNTKNSIWGLLALAAHSDAANSTPVITAIAAKLPQFAEATVGLLNSLSKERNDQAARATLRELLTKQTIAGPVVSAHTRTSIFAELVRAGDREAVPLLGTAFEMGLRGTSVQYSPLNGKRTDVRPHYADAPVFFLMENGTPDPWHGYEGADLREAWRVLFASEKADEIWTSLVQHSGNRVPVAALPIFGRELLARWQDEATGTVAANQPSLCNSFAGIRAEDLASVPDLEATVLELLTSQKVRLPLSVFARLERSIAQRFAAQGLAQMQRDKSPEWFGVLVDRRVPLSAEAWRAALTTSNYQAHMAALRGIGKDTPASVRPLLEADLERSEPSIRDQASRALVRRFGVDAVPSLLPMLQDEDDKVRESIQQQLQALRDAKEQRRFWSKDQSIDLTPAGAAAKLVGQAMPGQEKPQRLLAIRSLALLRAAESLPYLIDWTKDEDPEVAAAAKKAIADIHENGGPAKAGGKK